MAMSKRARTIIAMKALLKSPKVGKAQKAGLRKKLKSMGVKA